MSKNTSEGFLFPFSDNDCEIGREFMKNPDQFLEERDLTYEDIQCPQECHDALKRGEDFAADAEDFGTIDNAEDVQQLDELASSHFGDDYEVEYAPFGLEFSEKVTITPETAGTATATASVTFLDADADTDS